ncbi:MAG: DUF4469 domain-containing protein [Bacteroidales bacterium]|nr:DUF4469 domain-containing protein [Bacteroidales bacterium]
MTTKKEKPKCFPFVIYNSKLFCLHNFPAGMGTGKYELRVTTQHSHGGKLLSTPRTAVLSTLITVI